VNCGPRHQYLELPCVHIFGWFETTEILVKILFAEKTPFANLDKMSKKYGRVKTPFQKHKCVHVSDKHEIVGKLLATKNNYFWD